MQLGSNISKAGNHGLKPKNIKWGKYMKTVKMGEMTVLDVRNYLKKNKTIILPYGVDEQHG